MSAWNSDQSNNAPDSDQFGYTLDSTDKDLTQDSRDDRASAITTSKKKSTNSQFPQYNYDSSLRSMLETAIEPSILNEYISLNIEGKNLPVGFAEYVDPTITPLNYNYYFIPGWRVAIPRVIPMEQVNNILNTILYKGPRSAGFTRIGDTLVPSMLSPGDRMILAYVNL